MQFEMLKEKSSIIKVIGVGGGGGNAVNHMYRQGITGVDFIICNTDAQALELSPIPNKVQLGASLTEGMGAGSIPEVGKNSAIENIDDIDISKYENTNNKDIDSPQEILADFNKKININDDIKGEKETNKIDRKKPCLQHILYLISQDENEACQYKDCQFAHNINIVYT